MGFHHFSVWFLGDYKCFMITISKTIKISQCDLNIIKNVNKQTIKRCEGNKIFNIVVNFSILRSPTIWKFSLKKKQIALLFLSIHAQKNNILDKEERTKIFYE